MEIIPASDLRTYARLTTDELRPAFLASGLFLPGKVTLKYWETDRTVLGGVMPTRSRVALPAEKEVASAYFCERRELGILNTGGPGSVEVDGQSYALGTLDCLYVGRGARSVAFRSPRPTRPAQFFLLSYPAHAAHPPTLIRHAEVTGVALGAPETANGRTLYKYIHLDGVKSCQLVMGVTLLQRGCVWNTMPPHTHLRRSEVYLYFDVPAQAAVFHLMGQPGETRHLVVHDREAVLSPPWSIHSGVGTENYGFIWGMGGENQVFADMDPVPIPTLR